MSIATAITNAQGKVAAAYTAVDNMGGTLPATQNLTNLPTAISSISTGITPTGTLNITANGTYGVDSYAYVDVNTTGSDFIGIPREISNSTYQMPSSSFTFSLPSGVTNLGDHVLQYSFYGNASVTSADFSNLTTITGKSSLHDCFSVCDNLTSLDFSNVTSITGNAALLAICLQSYNVASVDFSSLITLKSLGSAAGSILKQAFYQTAITSLSFPELTTIQGNSIFESCCYGCTSLSSVSFPKLTQIGIDAAGYTDNKHFKSAFQGCTSLTSISFPKLETIYCTSNTQGDGTFAGNNKVQKFYFPKLNTISYQTGASSSNQNAAKNIFYGCSSLTELHFGAANKSAIEATAGYSTLWGRGAGNATVYFDL